MHTLVIIELLRDPAFYAQTRDMDAGDSAPTSPVWDSPWSTLAVEFPPTLQPKPHASPHVTASRPPPPLFQSRLRPQAAAAVAPLQHQRGLNARTVVFPQGGSAEVLQVAASPPTQPIDRPLIGLYKDYKTGVMRMIPLNPAQRTRAPVLRAPRVRSTTAGFVPL